MHMTHKGHTITPFLKQITSARVKDIHSASWSTFRALVSLSINCIVSDHIISKLIVSILKKYVLNPWTQALVSVYSRDCLNKLIYNALHINLNNVTKFVSNTRKSLYIYTENS